MIKPRPLSTEFSLVWDHDPAVDRDRFAHLATEHDPKAGHKAFAEAWARAVEELNFGPLLKPGEQATRFAFRPLRGVALDAFRRAVGGFDEHAGVLAFRMCLVRVDDCEGFPKIEHVHHPELGPLVSPEIMAVLDQAGIELGAPMNHIAVTLGSHAFVRSTRPSPL
jgi:hypothetical protein